MLNIKSLIQDTVLLIGQSKLNLALQEYPADSLETLFYHLLDPASEKNMNYLRNICQLKELMNLSI